MSFVKLIGIIQNDGFVLTDDGKKYILPFRGIDKEEYLEVLINAKAVGGDGFFYRQSIKPYIGMQVEFTIDLNNLKYGMHDCVILKDKK
jgi:hypothetical protein